MPPGQPIGVCEDCGFIRPLRKNDDEWVCSDCHPEFEIRDGEDQEQNEPATQVDAGVEPPPAPSSGGDI